LIQAASFLPDGKLLVTGSVDRNLAVWDAASGGRLRVLTEAEGVEDAAISTLAFSTDGRRLAVGAANGRVVLWSVESWSKMHSWEAHRSAVMALGISPDGRWLATGCREPGGTTLRVWRLEGLDSLPGSEAFSSDRMNTGVFALDFSPDSRCVAAGGWGFSGYSAPMIYDLATGERICCLLYDASRALCYSPDGALLATGDEFGTVSLWNLATRERIVKKKGHDRIVSVVAFSPDGRRLVSGSCDGGLKLWDVVTGDLLREEAYDGMVLGCRFSEGGGALSVAVAPPGADDPLLHCRTLD
jgi:WD40 repeat protein